MGDLKETVGKAIKCPQCKKTVAVNDNPYMPFCSERCKMVDLEAWLSGRYKISEEKNNDIIFN